MWWMFALAGAEEPGKVRIRSTDPSTKLEIEALIPPGPGQRRGTIEPLCTTPCTVQLPVGKHRVRFSANGSKWARTINVLDRPSALVCKPYRAGTAGVGFALIALVVTSPIGIALVATSGGRCKPA